MITLPDHPLVTAALAWEKTAPSVEPPSDRYCATRDVLSARIWCLKNERLRSGISENEAGLLDGVISEIGGNAFDHNVGNWSGVPGVFFGYDLSPTPRVCVIADRGQGIRATISRIRPDVGDDLAALKVAFLERLSARAPERRGNGLKFVRNALLSDGIDLIFQSGAAQYSVQEKNEEWGTNHQVFKGCIAILTWSL